MNLKILIYILSFMNGALLGRNIIMFFTNKWNKETILTSIIGLILFFVLPILLTRLG